MAGFWASILIISGINAIITTGLYISNSAGALSSAHAAIAGLGGYMGAVVTTNYGGSLSLALLAGLAVGYALGAFLAVLTLHMSELVAGLTTLAFGETMVVIIYNIDYLGGANSFTGIPFLTNVWNVYVILALILLFAWRFERSRLGYAAAASRHTPLAASAMGINVRWVKTNVFAIGGSIAAVGGVLNAHFVLVQNPSTLGFWVSVNYIVFWALGGSYSFWGAAVGAIVLSAAPEILRFSDQSRFILYGLLIVILLILRPDGLIKPTHLRARRVVDSDGALNAADVGLEPRR